MHRRQALPRRVIPSLWLMTDERQGDALLPALRRLPRGSGVVFRHYTLAGEDRRRLFEQVRRVARARRLVLLLAGTAAAAAAWRADGWHGRDHRRASRPMLHSAPAHDRRELATAAAADFVFVSPVYATRSHPGGRVLGRLGFRRLAVLSARPVVALGGMDAARARGLGAHGWAGIDALSG